MKTHSNIGAALFPKIKRQILTTILMNSRESWTISALIAKTQNSSGAVQRELKRLVDAGILLKKPFGNTNLYSANTNCMIYSELRGIVIKTFGVSDTIKDHIQSLSKKIDLALVYGSIATGQDTAESDVDILIVGGVSLREIVSKLKKAEEVLRRDINPTVYTATEFRNKLTHENHFVSRIIKSPTIPILGDLSGFTKLAK